MTLDWFPSHDDSFSFFIQFSSVQGSLEIRNVCVLVGLSRSRSWSLSPSFSFPTCLFVYSPTWTCLRAEHGAQVMGTMCRQWIFKLFISWALPASCFFLPLILSPSGMLRAFLECHFHPFPSLVGLRWEH